MEAAGWALDAPSRAFRAYEEVGSFEVQVSPFEPQLGPYELQLGPYEPQLGPF